MAMTCAWCGGGPLTREHLLPQWLAKVLAEAFPADEGYNFGYVFTTAEGESEPRTYSQDRPELIVKAVCDHCNGGWMSALEGEVKQFLEPMVRGEHVLLGIGQQMALARWAAKLAVLLDHYQEGVVILGPTDMDQVLRWSAPIGFHIRLALRGEANPPPFDIYLSNHLAASAGVGPADAGPDPEPNSFSVTFGFGRVAISIVGGPAIENPDRWTRGSDFPLMIWPPTPGGIEWPSAHPVLRSREELRTFHEAFWTAVLNPDFPRPDALRHAKELDRGQDPTG